MAVVKDGKEMVCASYGLADVEENLPVTGNTTFPACSVSKMFTATAIMQLSEQGKIDLSEDISVYVPEVKIKNPYNKEITCQQLLTHSSGLDEQSELDGSTLDYNHMKTQLSYFTNHIPTVIHEPGTVSCYSNMGYNILGYIVEKVSGESYEEYMMEHILAPLQMSNSSVRTGDSDMASGYCYENGYYEKQGFAYQYTSGSSGIISTVKDMENFMIMHLNLGKFKNTTILNSHISKEMQEKQFANDEVFDGMGYGWIRTHYNKTEIIKHEGALPGYATTMFLIPQDNIGIYVATNSTTGICFDFEDAFMERFYGNKAVEGSINAERITMDNADEEELSAYTGIYRSYDGIARKNMMKVGIIFDNTTDMKVVKEDKDTLKVTYYNQKKERMETTLKYCGKGVFKRKDGRGYITFSSKTDNGPIEYAFTQVSHCTYEKIKFYEKKSFLLGGTISFVILFISSILLSIKRTRNIGIPRVYKIYYNLIISGQLVSFSCTILSIILTMYMISSYNCAGLKVLEMSLAAQAGGAILMISGSLYGICKSFGSKKITKRIVLIYMLFTVQIVSVLELCYFNLLGINIF